MFSSLKHMADSLAIIAAHLDKISVALDDLVELQYRDAGITRTTTVLPPLPPEKEHTQVIYASDAASYLAEQRDAADQDTEVH